MLFSQGSTVFLGAAVVLAMPNLNIERVVCRHMLFGKDHTPHRAEIFGIILALESAFQMEIYCDCAAVVHDLQTIIRHLSNGVTWTPSDHEDLWSIVLSNIKDRFQSIRCHKTQGHVVSSSLLSPQARWEAWYNDFVDNQAKMAIMNDNSDTYAVFHQAYTAHMNQRSKHEMTLKFQARIAQKTFLLLQRKTCNDNEQVGEHFAPSNPDLGNMQRWCFEFNQSDCNDCLYNPLFMYRICTWAKQIEWEINPTGETSFLELFLEYYYTTKTLAPCNTLQPPFWLLFDQNPTCDSTGFSLKQNYLNFGKAIRWMERKFEFHIFPPERKTNCNSLRVFGWRGNMWGVRRKAHLHHRDVINNFLEPLQLYRAKSLEIPLRNPRRETAVIECAEEFVSPAVAYKNSLKRAASSRWQ